MIRLENLNDLNAKLQGIDQQYPSARLQGLAFHLTKNDSLGLKEKDPSDFKVNIPFREWPKNIEDPLPETTRFPSALQEAFKDVLAKGAENAGTCWIDIVSLDPSEKFFLENSGGDAEDSLVHAIRDVIKKVPDSETPVVRILAGADAHATSAKYWSDNHAKFERMFWNSKDGGKPLIDHPRAKLYVGYYGPTFKPASPEARSWINTLEGSVDNIVLKNEALIKAYKNDPFFKAKDLHVSDTIANYVNKDLPAISWNHGKLLVVNGKTMMTGGGNYWEQYLGAAHDIFDHQVKIKGDAAITAHEYTNYFFKYLRDIPNTDGRSLLRSILFKDVTLQSPPWSNQSPEATDLLASFKPTSTGTFPVLTVARLGDWSGSMNSIPYPVQVVDAIRDVGINVMWHLLPDSQQGSMIARLDYAFRDDSQVVLDSTLGKAATSITDWWFGTQTKASDPVPDMTAIFTDLQINPIAWASRYARKSVIEHATKNVYISQQMLVDTLQLNESTFKTALIEMNAKIKEKHLSKGSSEWDGKIWPYDLLAAIGWALSRISMSPDGEGVHIVLTTTKSGIHKTWEDVSAVSEFKRRLAIIMKGMAQQKTVILTFFGLFIDENKVDGVIEKYLKVKRILDNKGIYYCHNKIVSVDGNFLYVGSDNAYPCYNEEHGVWIDDKATIEAWRTTYWKGLWDRSNLATD